MVFAGATSKAESFYVGAFGGANWVHLESLYQHRVGANSQTKYYGGAFAGYSVLSLLRFETEVAYRADSLDHLKHCGIKYDCDIHSHITSYMANVLLEINCLLLHPYCGFGAGYAVRSEHGNIDGVSHRKSDREYGSAWQFIAGASHPFLISCLEIGVEYRFFKVMNKMESHSAGLVVKAGF